MSEGPPLTCEPATAVGVWLSSLRRGLPLVVVIWSVALILTLWVVAFASPSASACVPSAGGPLSQQRSATSSGSLAPLAGGGDRPHLYDDAVAAVSTPNDDAMPIAVLERSSAGSRAPPASLRLAIGHRAAAEDAGGTLIGDAARACDANSFTATTLVTMADGSKRPISRVRLGDLVLATDPQTGDTAARPVTALIVHGGRHVMVDVTLADGATITATDHHPFWDASASTFVYADHLHVGDELIEANGVRIPVAGLRAYREDVAAYNLTVDGIHTYYAGATPVLVHNSCFQMNREIAQGARGTRGIDRVDRADPENGAFQDHVHFSDHDGTLNRDGTWGHEGEGPVTNAQQRWLRRWGWDV